MAIEHQVITLSTTPASILGANASTATSTTVFIQNLDASAQVYIGGDSTVSTTSFGVQLNSQYAGATIDNVGPGHSLYAVSGSTSCKVAVLRTVR